LGAEFLNEFHVVAVYPLSEMGLCRGCLLAV